MQKFALLFLAASTSFLGFLAPVEGQAVAKRETNGERFARGMGPLPPTKRSIYDGRVRDPKPSSNPWDSSYPKRSVDNEARDHEFPDFGPPPSKPSGKWNAPRSEDIEARDRFGPPPSKPSGKWNSPNKREDRWSKPSNKWNAPRSESIEARDRFGPPPSKPSSKWNAPDKREDRWPKPSNKWNGPSKRSEEQELVNRETNADRFARGLGPLPPTKRSPEDRWPKPSNKWNAPRSEDIEARDRFGPPPSKPSGKWNAPSKREDRWPKPSNKWNGPSKRSETEVVKRAEAYQMQQSYSGRLEVRWTTNNSIAGFVANNPNGGSFGLNDPVEFGADDLYVEYFDSNLLVMNPEFPSPYFVGGNGGHCSSGKVQVANVQPGPLSAIWTLNPFTRALTATWTNQDGSEDKPSLAYDPARNVLTFAGQYTPTEYLVSIYLSD